jgi:hypothetical protein
VFAALVTVWFVLSMVALVLTTPSEPARLEIVKPDAHVPTWTAALAADFPGCVDNEHARFLPRTVVTVTRAGAVGVWNYDEFYESQVRCSWRNEDPADDLFTVGRCREGER